MNKNKTNTHVSAVCNDGVKRVLYNGDDGSVFIKRKGNDGRMMFVPFTKPKNVKNQNGGWGMCRNGSCNANNAQQGRQPNVTHERRTEQEEDELERLRYINWGKTYTHRTINEQNRVKTLSNKDPYVVPY